jgi:hypothetical protein
VSSIGRVVTPVLVVAAVLALAIGSRLGANDGHLTGFIQFGSSFARFTHPPTGASTPSALGYDGQFFYVQALDPLLLRDSTVRSLGAAGAGFRMQRAAYPALAFLIAAGRRGAIPFALLAVNVMVLLAVAAGFAIYARRRDWSPLWAVPIALMPGMLLPTVRDLSDPLATAGVLAGLLAWRGGRRWPAALALTVAVLTREVMIVVVVAIAVDAAARAWRAREVSGAPRDIALRAWPVLVLPSAAFAAWQAYITARYGGPVGGAGLGLPLMNLVQEVRGSIHSEPPFIAAWDLVYVLLMLAATVAALMSLRRRVTVTSAGASVLALGVLVPTFGDLWSDTRLSAPLFAVLLVDGLQRRDRPSVMISAAAAAMTILIPFWLPGSF